MIKAHLESQLNNNKLYNSWIIEAQDNLKALAELKNFVEQNLLGQAIPLEIHPDFKLIEKPSSGVGSKNISIEQIRGLQTFFSKTSGISNYKVAIIFQADQMNLNAANGCLKILEDTPKNSYIFLITTSASRILPTILSRCSRINPKYENQLVNAETYEKYIKTILVGDIDAQIVFLKELSDRNRELWLDFSFTIKTLIIKVIKKSLNVALTFSDSEATIAERLKSRTPNELIKKFDEMNELIDNTINYDLDLRASAVLLINQFRS